VLFRLTYLQVLLLLGISCAVQAQTKNTYLTSEEVFKKDGYNPLTPARAAFYSAILPGLGQTYNKDYWKVPIVYGALAIPIYYYATNNTTYKKYRHAFKLREAGLKDEFVLENGTTLISRSGLISAQKTLKQNRDTSLLTFAALYVLQVLEASVSAHLLQFNVNDQLSFDPKIYQTPYTDQTVVGIALNINF
jgi:hypothetical protein